jgi:hypothetical protein
MKPNANSGITAKLSPAPFPLASTTARIVQHPRSKKAKDTTAGPPDEETLLRLNAMAKQYPFCIQHRGKNALL